MSNKTSFHKSIDNHSIRSAFDGLADTFSESTSLFCPEPTLTQQQFADEADINTIVNKFLRTGEMPDEVSRPQFGDFTQTVNNYQDALNLVLAADEAFNSLPAAIRTRFDNDPAKYVEFFENPKNADEAIELGLALKPQDSSERSPQDRVEEESSRAEASQNSSSSKGGKKASKVPSEGGE